MPWAEVLVNGARVRLPHQLSAGDVVSLRVRAESKAEIEAEEVAREEGKERVDPIRAAALRYGDVEGTLERRRPRSACTWPGTGKRRWDRSKAAAELAAGCREGSGGGGEGAAEDAATNETNATETRATSTDIRGTGSAAVGITSTRGAEKASRLRPRLRPQNLRPRVDVFRASRREGRGVEGDSRDGARPGPVDGDSPGGSPARSRLRPRRRRRQTRHGSILGRERRVRIRGGATIAETPRVSRTGCWRW